jgi:hypothetical protein
MKRVSESNLDPALNDCVRGLVFKIALSKKKKKKKKKAS